MNYPSNSLRIVLALRVAVVMASLCVTAFSATFVGSNTGALVDGTQANPDIPTSCGNPSRDVTFAVSGLANPITSVSTTFAMTHSRIGDLDIRLISPDGTSFVIMSRVGAVSAGDQGDSSNLNGTYTFTDSTAGGIWAAAFDAGGSAADIPPGSYRTQQVGPNTGPGGANPGPAFTQLNTAFIVTNPSPNGTWILRFNDCAQNDTGSVSSATLTLSGPTGATGVISGRARDIYGRGISRAQISITDVVTGETRSTVSNPFGYFSLPDLLLGQTYILQIGHKRFVFEEEVRTIQLLEETEIEFIGHRR